MKLVRNEEEEKKEDNEECFVSKMRGYPVMTI